MVPVLENYNDYISRLFPEFHEQGKRIYTLTLQVTEDCNLCCTYCYQIAKTPHVMSYETAIEFLTLLLDDKIPYVNTSNTCGLALEFIGGEPLLEIELIDKITEWILNELVIRKHPWRNFIRFSIPTNGVLYFKKEVQDYLRKYDDFVSLSISLDGNKQLHDSCRLFPNGHGSYDVVAKAAKDWLNKRRNLVTTKMTLSPDNIQYTSDAIIDLINLGYRYVHANCVYEEGWTIDHARILYHEMQKLTDWLFENDMYDSVYIRLYDSADFSPKSPYENRNYCGGTGEMLVLDWQGYLYPCLRYTPTSLGNCAKPIILGKIVDGNLEISEESTRCFECLQKVTRRSQSTDECYYCPIATGCGWCSAYNYQCGDVNKRQTHICWMHKARALASYEFWTRYHQAMNDGVVIENRLLPEWIEVLQA